MKLYSFLKTICLYRLWSNSLAWSRIADWSTWPFLPIQLFHKHSVCSISFKPRVPVSPVGVCSVPGTSSPSAWSGTLCHLTRWRSSTPPPPHSCSSSLHMPDDSCIFVLNKNNIMFLLLSSLWHRSRPYSIWSSRIKKCVQYRFRDKGCVNGLWGLAKVYHMVTRNKHL